MRRAHSWRRLVRLAERWVTSSLSRSLLCWLPFVSTVSSAIPLLRSVAAGEYPRLLPGLARRPEGQDRDVVAQLAVGRREHRVLDTVGHLGRAEAAASLQQLEQLVGAEDLGAAPADLGHSVGVEHQHVAQVEFDGDV